MTLEETKQIKETKSTSSRAKVPFSEQYHLQRIWNLFQIIKETKFDVVTIGFSQKSIENFVEELKVIGVKLLVDVRKNPSSRYKPQFNKVKLKQTLKTNGIEYEHMEDLGVTRQLRDRLHSKEITNQEFFEIYDERILTKNSINCLLDRIDQFETIALLCTEVSPTLCHRHRIALELIKEGKKCYDL